DALPICLAWRNVSGACPSSASSQPLSRYLARARRQKLKPCVEQRDEPQIHLFSGGFCGRLLHATASAAPRIGCTESVRCVKLSSIIKATRGLLLARVC